MLGRHRLRQPTAATIARVDPLIDILTRAAAALPSRCQRPEAQCREFSLLYVFPIHQTKDHGHRRGTHHFDGCHGRRFHGHGAAGRRPFHGTDLKLHARLWKSGAREYSFAGASAGAAPNGSRQLQSPTDREKFETIRQIFNTKGAEVEREVDSARALIGGLIQSGSTFGDETALVRIDSRLDDLFEGIAALSERGNRAAIARSRSERCARGLRRS